MEEGQYSVLAEISREMVRVYKDQFGRGPTKARTQWAGPDMLMTLLEDTLTPVERRLVTMGEQAACATCGRSSSTRRGHSSASRWSGSPGARCGPS